MNRTTVGRFQSCGANGDSAFIGPCTGDDDLLAVIRSIVLTPDGGRMTVDWDTSLEVNNAGFNVLRRDLRGGGGWTVVNSAFLPGAGDSVTGASYRFEDLSALDGVEYQYRIEDIDFNGVNGLSSIHRGVPNPAAPSVKLRGPSYGEPVSLRRGLKLAVEGRRVMHGAGLLQVSPDPTFGTDVAAMPVPLQLGTRSFSPNRRMLTSMQEGAEASGGVLYWRVADRGGNPISDTFRMEVQ
jgi:hypothetical protein